MPRIRRLRFALPLCALLLAAVACGGDDSDDEPTATLTPTPAGTPTATAIPTPTPVPLNTAIARLEAAVYETVPAEARGTASDFEGITGIEVVPLDREGFFAAVSLGRPNFDPFVPHFLSTWEQADDSFEERGRVDLINAEVIEDGSLALVDIESSHEWIAVESTVGVRDASFGLARFDGETLVLEVDHINRPPAGQVGDDFDGDGSNEVIIDRSNYAVLCAACDVVEWAPAILRWDGESLVEEDLDLEAAAAANNTAVSLAEAGRWAEAAAAIAEVDLADPATSDQVAWNVAIIELVTEWQRENLDAAPVPLLQLLFAGDYPAALDLFRDVPVAEAFSAETPLLAGIPEGGLQPVAVERAVALTEAALVVPPETAALLFLRGWAESLSGGDPIPWLQQAAAADPADAYIAEALAFVAGE